MFNSVLLTIDLSYEKSWQKALPQAVELVRASKGVLHLVSIVPDLGTPMLESFFPQDFEYKAIEAANEALMELAKQEVPEDVTVKLHLTFGKIHEKILAAVDETDCDLVIMCPTSPTACVNSLLARMQTASCADHLFPFLS